MPAISRQVSSTSIYLGVFIPDATVSTGAGLANVSASTVSCTWCRSNMSSPSTFRMSTGTFGTWATSTLTQANSTTALGWYGLSVPDGVFDSGDSCLIHLYGAPNMAPVPIQVEVTKSNNQVYVSTVNVLGAINPVGVSTITVGVNASTVSGLVGVSTNNDKAAYSISSLTAAAAAAIADKLLGRNVSSGADGGRTVSEALYTIRNRVDVSTGIVYMTDDVTSSWAFAVSTIAGNPIYLIAPQ